MASPRQQRSARNRRQLTTYAPERVLLATPNIFDTTGASLVLNLIAISEPAGPGSHPVEFQLNGVPQIYRVSDATLADAATLDASHTQCTVHFPGDVIQRGELFFVGPWDPALRTSLGGFIAPTIMRPVAPASTVLAYTVTGGGTDTLTITPQTDGAGIVTFQPLGWRHEELGQIPSSCLWTEGTGTITFPAPVPVGETIRYVGPVAINYSQLSGTTATVWDVTPVVVG